MQKLSFEEACAKLAIDPAALPDVSRINERDGKAILANYKMGILARAYNLPETGKEWEVDFGDDSQYKWTPWFVESGSGLSFGAADVWHSYTSVGSRLCFRTEEICEFVATEHIDLYRELLS